MDVVKAGDIARQAPTDISSTLRTLPGVDIVDKQTVYTWRQRMDLRSGCTQPDSGGWNEYAKSQNRRNQLEHRAFGEYRAD